MAKQRDWKQLSQKRLGKSVRFPVHPTRTRDQNASSQTRNRGQTRNLPTKNRQTRNRGKQV